jgi:hypothetical protein
MAQLGPDHVTVTPLCTVVPYCASTTQGNTTLHSQHAPPQIVYTKGHQLLSVSTDVCQEHQLLSASAVCVCHPACLCQPTGPVACWLLAGCNYCSSWWHRSTATSSMSPDAQYYGQLAEVVYAANFRTWNPVWSLCRQLQQQLPDVHRQWGR